MAYLRKRVEFRKLSAERLAAWSTVATNSASDMMNRGQAMHASIKPVTTATAICGQARTIQCIFADNSILHFASSTAERGEVLVADVGGVTDAAVWGGITTIEAFKRGLGGLVVDGSVRDIKQSRDVGLPIFCKGITPRGPHKAFGGALDIPIACGGLAVRPGDLILGDEDGIVVVPLDQEEVIFEKVMKFRKTEDYWMEILNSDTPFYQVLNIPTPDFMD
jgi:regulator of RNase E activity RraA